MIHVEYEETMEEAAQNLESDVQGILGREDVEVVAEYKENGKGVGVLKVVVKGEVVGEIEFNDTTDDTDYFELQDKVLGIAGGAE